MHTKLLGTVGHGVPAREAVGKLDPSLHTKVSRIDNLGRRVSEGGA